MGRSRPRDDKKDSRKDADSRKDSDSRKEADSKKDSKDSIRPDRRDTDTKVKEEKTETNGDSKEITDSRTSKSPKPEPLSPKQEVKTEKSPKREIDISKEGRDRSSRLVFIL